MRKGEHYSWTDGVLEVTVYAIRSTHLVIRYHRGPEYQDIEGLTWEEVSGALVQAWRMLDLDGKEDMLALAPHWKQNWPGLLMFVRELPRDLKESMRPPPPSPPTTGAKAF